MIDPRIPLMIQQPNVLAALDAGTTAASNQANVLRQAEGQNLFRQYGAGAMQGDRNALAQIAGFDPAMAQDMRAGQLDMRATEQSMAFAAEEMQMVREQTARALAGAADQEAAMREAQDMGRIVQEAVRAFASGDERTWSNATASAFGQALPMSEDGIAVLGAFHEGAKAYLDARPKAPEMTAEMQSLTWRADQAGLKPGTPEYREFIARGGAQPRGTSLSVTPDGAITFNDGVVPAQTATVLDQANLKAGSGQTRVQDATSPTGTRIVAEPGSEAAAAEEAAARAAEAAKRNEQTRLDVVTRTTTGIRDLLKDKGFWNRVVTADLPESGIWGERAQGFSQEARDLAERISTLQGMVAFDRLEKMKAASSTGASGLGQVTEREISLLAAQLGALSPGASREIILETLNTVESVFGKLSPQAQAYLLGTSEVEPWTGGGGAPAVAPPAPAAPQMRWRFNPETGDFE
jgi:hypothetical protein